MERGLSASGFDKDLKQMRKKKLQEAKDLDPAGYVITMDHRDYLDPTNFPECTKKNKTVQDLQGEFVSDKLQKNMDRWSAKTQEESNTFISEFKSIEERRERNRIFKGKALSDTSSKGPREGMAKGKEATRELRQLLKDTGSLFPGVGVKRCPFPPEECNGGNCGKHCIAFWKPILKQEKRTERLCNDDCKFCHNPRHFPDEEWVRLNVHRATAARRREKKKNGTKKKDDIVDAEPAIAESESTIVNEPTIADSALPTADAGSSSRDASSSPDLSAKERWVDMDLDWNELCSLCEEEEVPELPEFQ